MFESYYYPYYRSPGAFISPYPYAYPYYNYSSGINAFQSQLANQSVVNTGIAAGINQIANPTNIY
jgi:hypothetical protein